MYKPELLCSSFDMHDFRKPTLYTQPFWGKREKKHTQKTALVKQQNQGFEEKGNIIKFIHNVQSGQ